jgi:hypothetical protein
MVGGHSPKHVILGPETTADSPSGTTGHLVTDDEGRWGLVRDDTSMRDLTDFVLGSRPAAKKRGENG